MESSSPETAENTAHKPKSKQFIKIPIFHFQDQKHKEKDIFNGFINRIIIPSALISCTLKMYNHQCIWYELPMKPVTVLQRCLYRDRPEFLLERHIIAVENPGISRKLTQSLKFSYQKLLE